MVPSSVVALRAGSGAAGNLVERDSFRTGLLDHPHYTRPAVVEGLAVPPVLLSGDHAAIERWRRRRRCAPPPPSCPTCSRRRPLSEQQRDDSNLQGRDGNG